jgi:Flp pilus assembly protein TadG
MKSLKHKSERGNALLEFALGWSILWALFAGIYQFGYSFYVYNTVLTSVGNAAELGSKMTYDTASATTEAAFQTALKNMVVYGSTTAGNSPIVPGLTTSMVTIGVNPSTYPTDITVTINGFTINALFTSFTFNGKPRATAVYMGNIICSNC